MEDISTSNDQPKASVVGDGKEEGDIHTNDSSDDVRYPSPTKLAVLLFGSCLGAFLVGLDSTIITTAIPRITDDFHSTADVGWYGSAYLLLACAFQPLFGRIYTHFDVRKSYFVALGSFLLGSLICGVAPSSIAVIVGRAFAGLGCAGIIAGNLNIVALSSPLATRSIYISLLGAVFGIGLVCGPIIGGALTDRVTWRWCFYLSLPVGAVTFLSIVCFFHPQKAGTERETFGKRLRRLDLPGNLLIMTAIVMLLLALQWGGISSPWKSAKIIGLLVGCGIELIIFVIWQNYRSVDALIPLRIMTDRTVASTVVASFFQSGATFVYTFYLPYWFQVVRDASPLSSGVDLIPWMVANFLAAMVTGFAVTKTGWFNPPVLLGPVVGTIGAGLLATLQTDTSVGKWIGYEILSAAGLGAARQQYFLSVQAVLPPEDIPIAISFVLFSQNLAGAVFVSVGNSLIRNSLSRGLSNAQFSSGTILAILNAGATNASIFLQPGQQATLLEVYNTALRDVFIMAIPLTVLSLVCAIPMKWKNLKSSKAT